MHTLPIHPNMRFNMVVWDYRATTYQKFIKIVKSFLRKSRNRTIGQYLKKRIMAPFPFSFVSLQPYVQQDQFNLFWISTHEFKTNLPPKFLPSCNCVQKGNANRAYLWINYYDWKIYDIRQRTNYTFKSVFLFSSRHDLFELKIGLFGVKRVNIWKVCMISVKTFLCHRIIDEIYFNLLKREMSWFY